MNTAENKLKIVFLVQGEGRGHMTQAIALSQLLTERGHQISHVFVGGSLRREVPQFFKDSMHAPIELLPSPNFELDDDNKSLRIWPSILKNTKQAKLYLSSVKRIKEVVKSSSPDIIVNFYDLLGGLYQLLNRHSSVQYYCVGHQYLALHKHFPFPKGRLREKLSFQLLNYVTLIGADKVLALSFSKYEDFDNPKRKVVPPLLRREMRSAKSDNGDHILAYVVNDGYGKEIEKSHKDYSDIPLVCFWDSKSHDDKFVPHDNIIFYQLNGDLFKEMLRSAKAYMCTAGFESVCEAMYMGKKLMVVPVENHYEQACNALDAMKTGLAVSNDKFELTPLINSLGENGSGDRFDQYREWVNCADEVFIAHFE